LPTEANILASAEGMIENFGEAAQSKAREIANRMAYTHDADGTKMWRAIAAKIAELDRQNIRRIGEPSHTEEHSAA
jgi:hypothetical protein